MAVIRIYQNYLFPIYLTITLKHRDALNAIIKEKDYQANLLHNNLYGNRVILWKQYYNKLNQQKQKLIDKTNDQLNQLYKDYYHLNEQKSRFFRTALL